MSSVLTDHARVPSASRPSLDHRPGGGTVFVFLALLGIGLTYAGYSLVNDIGSTAQTMTLLPFLLLGVALLIALGFEFVNGFHDTANAVATVIYTHALQPHAAVVYSGTLNFLGVLFSSGAVAFGIISLLPVELILQVGTSAGFAMVFALLIAAIIWNLGTWWLGLPASSSHTLIGSIIGVGVANALMRGRDGTSGVDWSQATKIGWSLLISRWWALCALPCYSCSSRHWSRTARSTRSPRASPRRPGGSAACSSSPAVGCPSRTARTTARRAWASSC
jgi:PiT family inorganic phosphate transporter